MIPFWLFIREAYQTVIELVVYKTTSKEEFLSAFDSPTSINDPNILFILIKSLPHRFTKGDFIKIFDEVENAFVEIANRKEFWELSLQEIYETAPTKDAKALKKEGWLVKWERMFRGKARVITALSPMGKKYYFENNQWKPDLLSRRRQFDKAIASGQYVPLQVIKEAPELFKMFFERLKTVA